MSHLQTMFQLTGRGHAPASLNNATLLIIDAQEEYRSGVLALPGLNPALAEIANLLAAARSAGADIVHVKHLGIPGGLLDPSGPRGRHLPEVARWPARSWSRSACPTPSPAPNCTTACRRSAIST